MDETQPQEEVDSPRVGGESESQLAKPDQPAVELTGVRDLIREVVSISVQESWSAPLPKPADFVAYNEAQPDASERILKMTERQQRIQGMDLILNASLIALGIVGAIWGPGMGDGPWIRGAFIASIGLAIGFVNVARWLRRRPSRT